MENNIFSLRIDIDSLVGLKNGVPYILDILKKYNIKASFYITLGREGNFFEVLKYKFWRNENKVQNKKKFPNSRLKKISDRKLEIFKALFYPTQLASLDCLLKRIKEEGHGVGLHSYVHVKWRNINEKEIEGEFKTMIKNFKDIFQFYPNSFASPYFNHNKVVLDGIKKNKFKYTSCLSGIYPFIPKGYSHIEIPVNTKITSSNFPLIEYFARKGYDDNKILKQSINLIEKNMKKFGLVTTYIHPRIEGYYFINIFEKLMSYINKKGYNVKTYEEVGNIFCGSKN